MRRIDITATLLPIFFFLCCGRQSNGQESPTIGPDSTIAFNFTISLMPAPITTTTTMMTTTAPVTISTTTDISVDTATAMSTTTMSVTTGPSLNTSTVVALLTTVYNTTTEGFKELQLWDNTAAVYLESYTINYFVACNLSFLNEQHLLNKTGVIKDLDDAANFIVNYAGTVDQFWVVDSQASDSTLQDGLTSATQQIVSEPCNMQQMCLNVKQTCVVNRHDSGSLQCVDQCTLFVENDFCPVSEIPGSPSSSNVDGIVYVHGTCQFDNQNSPYCDCGKSPWNVMDNFYDGHNCVSSAFVVGMAAAGAGFLVVILLVAIGVVCAQNSKKEEELKKASALSTLEQPMNAFDTPQTDLGHVNVAMYSDAPDVVKTNGVNAYKDSDAYKNFEVNLQNVDPYVDYKIKRPVVAIRPTDNYYTNTGAATPYPEMQF